MVVRTLQDLAHVFSRDRRALVLTAPRVELPSELAALASLVKLELPTEADLRTLAQEVFGSLARHHKLGPPPGPDILDKIAGALRGLTLFEAERALTRAVLDDLTLGPRDIEVIAEMKKELLSRERVLDCVPQREGLDDVGGLRGLKTWLEKRRQGVYARGQGVRHSRPARHPAPGRAGLREEPGRQGRRQGLGACRS